MSCPGCRFNFETSAARSPWIKCELFHASFVKVLDATNFGMLLNRSANASGSFLLGQAAANPSYVTRPRRSASVARSSSTLNCWVSSLQNGKLHFSGDSTTPSSDANRVAANVRVPGIDSVPSVQPKTNTSVFGEAERQGHESELDGPTTVGAASATVAAASYLGFVFPLTRLDIFLVAAGILIAAFVVNYAGIRFTGRVQVATVAAILVALAIAVVASAPRIAPANYAPFLPNGVTSIGTAAALIVWSYLGYENTSNVAEEFRDPERDFHRSVVISVILISGLYLAVAFVTVGTGAYLVGGGATPFAAMMSSAFGTYGGAIVALLAVFVTFGTVNAYVAGMARVYYAAARDGVFPKMLAAVDRTTGAPRQALVFLTVLVLLSLVIFYILAVDFVSAFLMASGLALLTYVIGSIAGIRLLKERGMRRALPWISLAVSVSLLPFIGSLLAASVAIAGVGLLISWALSRRRTGGNRRT